MSDPLPARGLRAGLAWLLYLLRTILFGWALALVRLLRLLLRRRRRPEGSDRDRRAADGHCVVVDHPAFVRPDPLIYSQRYLRELGLAVTWDNPDIVLLRNGVPVDSHDLDPAIQYEVRARIWNDSLDAPVFDMPVHLSFRDFGIGTDPIPIGTATVDVGVKGGAGQPAFVSIPWTTPAAPGHYCLQVLLDPVDDRVPGNNLGQENTDVRQAQSPAVFSFTLRNDTPRRQAYRFEADAYELPEREPCSPEGRPAGDALEHHRLGRHPVPVGFTVDVSPSSPTLDPGQSTPVQVSVEPPAGFLGRQRVNVNAFHEQGLAGGVTFTVVKE